MPGKIKQAFPLAFYMYILICDFFQPRFLKIIFGGTVFVAAWGFYLSEWGCSSLWCRPVIVVAWLAVEYRL